MDDSAGQFLEAVRPLVERIGASLVDPAEIAADDVPLVWSGALVAGVRFIVRRTHDPDRPAGVGDDASRGLALILDDVQGEFGTPLTDLPRRRKAAGGSPFGGERCLRLPQVGRDRGGGARSQQVHDLQLPEPGPRLTPRRR